MLIGRIFLFIILLFVVINMLGIIDINDLNEFSFLLKVVLLLLLVIVKFFENVYLFFLYIVNILGMNGVEVFFLYILVVFFLNFVNGVKVEVIVFVWNVFCLLSDKWKLFFMKVIFVGLEYIVLICVEVLWVNIFKNNMCWLVFVRRFFVKVEVEMISNLMLIKNNFFI